MKSRSCPISLISVDGNIARINAFYVGILFGLYLLTMNYLILYFLIFDFSIRLFSNKKYSFILFLSTQTKKILRIRSDRVDYAPKKLAMYFGLMFLLSIFITHILHFTFLFYLFSVVLLACISLEAFFSYCLGCEIYHLYKRFII